MELELPGAPSVHTRELAQALAALGHEVHVIAPRCPEQFRPKGCHFHGVLFKGFERPRILAYSVLEVLVLLRLWFTARPDVVLEREHPGRWLPTWICRVLKLPRIAELNTWIFSGPEWDALPPERQKTLLECHRASYRNASGIIAVAPAAMERIHELLGVPLDRMRHIYLGVDVEQFSTARPAPLREQLGLAADDILVMYTGLLSEMWDLETVIRGVARARETRPEIRLILAGDGRDRARLQQLAAELRQEEAVFFLGRRVHGEIPSILAAADICISSYYPHVLRAIGEPLGTKFLEYLACGKARIVTELPEAPLREEFVACARAARAGDPESIATALLELAADPDARARMGAVGRELASRRYTWQEIARQTVEFAHLVLERGLP